MASQGSELVTEPSAVTQESDVPASTQEKTETASDAALLQVGDGVELRPEESKRRWRVATIVSVSQKGGKAVYTVKTHEGAERTMSASDVRKRRTAGVQAGGGTKRSASNGPATGVFKPGDAVEANYNGKWYVAAVKEAKGTGKNRKYTVVWHSDKSETDGLGPTDLREKGVKKAKTDADEPAAKNGASKQAASKEPEADATFAEGEAVEVRPAEATKPWRNATISSVTKPGSGCGVMYMVEDAEGFLKKVPAKDVRKKGANEKPATLPAKTPSVYKPGDAVEANYNGKWYVAAVKEAKGTGKNRKYTVVWHSDKSETDGLGPTDLREKAVKKGKAEKEKPAVAAKAVAGDKKRAADTPAADKNEAPAAKKAKVEERVVSAENASKIIVLNDVLVEVEAMIRSQQENVPEEGAEPAPRGRVLDVSSTEAFRRSVKDLAASVKVLESAGLSDKDSKKKPASLDLFALHKLATQEEGKLRGERHTKGPIAMEAVLSVIPEGGHKRSAWQLYFEEQKRGSEDDGEKAGAKQKVIQAAWKALDKAEKQAYEKEAKTIEWRRQLALKAAPQIRRLSAVLRERFLALHAEVVKASEEGGADSDSEDGGQEEASEKAAEALKQFLADAGLGFDYAELLKEPEEKATRGGKAKGADEKAAGKGDNGEAAELEAAAESPEEPVAPRTLPLRAVLGVVAEMRRHVTRVLDRVPLTKEDREEARKKKNAAAKAKLSKVPLLKKLRDTVFERGIVGSPGEADAAVVTKHVEKLTAPQRTAVMDIFTSGTWADILYLIRDLIDDATGQPLQVRAPPAQDWLAAALKSVQQKDKAYVFPDESTLSLPPLVPPKSLPSREQVYFGELAFCWLTLHNYGKAVRLTRFPLHHFMEAMHKTSETALLKSIFVQLLCQIENASEAAEDEWVEQVLSHCAKATSMAAEEESDEEESESDSDSSGSHESDSGSGSSGSGSGSSSDDNDSDTDSDSDVNSDSDCHSDSDSDSDSDSESESGSSVSSDVSDEFARLSARQAAQKKRKAQAAKEEAKHEKAEAKRKKRLAAERKKKAAASAKIKKQQDRDAREERRKAEQKAREEKRRAAKEAAAAAAAEAEAARKEGPQPTAEEVEAAAAAARARLFEKEKARGNYFSEAVRVVVDQCRESDIPSLSQWSPFQRLVLLRCLVSLAMGTKSFEAEVKKLEASQALVKSNLAVKEQNAVQSSKQRLDKLRAKLLPPRDSDDDSSEDEEAASAAAAKYDAKAKEEKEKLARSLASMRFQSWVDSCNNAPRLLPLGSDRHGRLYYKFPTSPLIYVFTSIVSMPTLQLACSPAAEQEYRKNVFAATTKHNAEVSAKLFCADGNAEESSSEESSDSDDEEEVEFRAITDMRVLIPEWVVMKGTWGVYKLEKILPFLSSEGAHERELKAQLQVISGHLKYKEEHVPERRYTGSTDIRRYQNKFTSRTFTYMQPEDIVDP